MASRGEGAPAADGCQEGVQTNNREQADETEEKVLSQGGVLSSRLVCKYRENLFWHVELSN